MGVTVLPANAAGHTQVTSTCQGSVSQNITALNDSNTPIYLFYYLKAAACGGKLYILQAKIIWKFSSNNGLSKILRLKGRILGKFLFTAQ